VFLGLSGITIHRLFIVYHRITAADGAIQQVSDLGVHPPAAHVDVLRHRHLSVPELVGADTRGEPFIVDKGGDGLAEAVRTDTGRAEFIANRTPLPV
jgi:hypothetical protein